MTWDDEKSTGDELTSPEWNDHVADQKNRTTPEEAADAAPIQSVFGRVGDVVAESGDYAASQISNFASSVIDSIQGEAIEPNSVTSQSVNTENRRTKNTRSVLTLSSSQTITGSDLTQIALDSVVDNQVEDFNVDTEDNKIIVPADTSIQINAMIQINNRSDVDGLPMTMLIQRDGGTISGSTITLDRESVRAGTPTKTLRTTQQREITLHAIVQDAGSTDSYDIRAGSDRTYLEVIVQ